MEITQLRYLKEVARQESFTRAAELLHITQSALSKSIAKLEDEVGVKLFERDGNRIHLNPFGKAMLRSSDQALVDLENGLKQVREMAGLEQGTVRVGVGAEVFIKHLVKEFLLRHPNVSMTCLLQSPEQMAASLEEGTMDFVVTTDPVDGSGINWQPIYTDQLTVLMSERHPLSERESIFLEELANDRFVISNMGPGMRSNAYELCRKAGFEPKVLYEGYDTEITGDLVAQGAAVMITPHSITEGVRRFMAENDPKPTVGIPLADSFTYKEIGIAAKQGHFQSAAALAFYEMIVNYFTSIRSV